MSRRVSVLLVAALLLENAAPAAAADTKPPKKTSVLVKKLPPLTFGLTGYSGAEGARADAEALQTYLTQKLGRNVATHIYPTPSALAAGLASGDVDVAWMQPFTLIEAMDKGAVMPIAKVVRHGLPFYRGVLFTQSGRDVTGLQGLKGLSIAWVDRSSAAGYLFPRAAIVSAGLKPAELFKAETFRGDHQAVCKAVAEGTADVGATYADDRPGEKPQIDGCVQSIGGEAAGKLKIIASSAPIPNDAIAGRPGLSLQEMERVKEVFLNLKKDHAGQMLLLSVFKATAFDTVGEDDFAPVRFAAQSAND